MEDKLREDVSGIRMPTSKKDLVRVLDQYESMQIEMTEIPRKIKTLERD